MSTTVNTAVATDIGSEKVSADLATNPRESQSPDAIESLSTAIAELDSPAVALPESLPTESVPSTPIAVAQVVLGIPHALLGSTTTPNVPLAASSLWTLMASARRDFEQTFGGSPVSVDPANSQTTTDFVDTPRVTTTSAPLADDQSLYTGQPSFITQVVVLGLRLVDIALKPFGGILAFTSLNIPFVTDGVPPFFLTGGLNVGQSQFDGMPVWTLQSHNPTGQHVVALHGGAYVAQVSVFHWLTYTALARDTGATVVVPLYPLIPQGGTAGVVVPQTTDFIAQLIQTHGAENVSVLGDSAGGGLAVAAVQELVRRGSPTPARMVLLAPWLDATVSDPRSQSIDPGDPLLDVPNLQTYGRQWAGGLDPADPFASPIYGSLAGLPPTTVFSGSLDLLTPDSLRLRQLALAEGLTNFSFFFGNGLIHDWPIFGFLPDAITTRPEIYEALLGTQNVGRADAAHITSKSTAIG